MIVPAWAAQCSCDFGTVEEQISAANSTLHSRLQDALMYFGSQNPA